MPPANALASDAAFSAALALVNAERHDQAEAALRRLLAKHPADHRAMFLLGQQLMVRGQVEQAIYQIRRAIDLAPAFPDYRLELSWTFRRLRRFADALAAAESARPFAPDRFDLYTELADSQLALGRVEDAAASLEHAQRLSPGHPRIQSSLGVLYHETARAEPAVHAIRAGLTPDTESPGAWANYAYVACASSALSPDQLLDAHRAVADWLRPPDDSPDPPLAVTNFDPDRRLRVAFISPDFCRHSVSYFFLPLADHLDPRQFELIAYYAANVRDEVTDRLRPRFALWRDVPGGRDSEIAAQLRADRVDIAIDLAGYTEGSLLYIFRRRICPVQATYLGYPHSSALPHVDYRLIDAHTDPPGLADRWATERLLRLPGCFLCYRPPDFAPTPRPRPADAPVRFGSFNRLIKVSAACRRLWARVLQEVPGSTLVLKDRLFAHEQGRRVIQQLFAADGLPPERLEFIARVPDPRDHLPLYHDLDIALDTTPYTGTTTTCEALWMGVPVVTLAGQHHASRVSASLLHAVGLDELIAESEDAFVDIAARLARDQPRRAALRASLRDRVTASPLRDEQGFATRFGLALRTMWHERAATLRGR